MKKLKIKSESERAIYIKMAEKIQLGWRVTKPIYKNWLGVYCVKLEKTTK